MTSIFSAKGNSRPRLLAALATAGCLGWGIQAGAASAVIRPPSVATGIDLGIWVITGPDDDTAMIRVARPAINDTAHPGDRPGQALPQRRAGGSFLFGRRAGTFSGA